VRIAFWGTPDFAVASLRALAEAGHDIVAAVTRPDRPFGRGRLLRPSAVKERALDMGTPVLQPDSPKEPGFAEALGAARPDLSVVVAYGRLIPTSLLDLPSLGSINLHASLLPELRGAAPIAWAIARGYETSGVSVMRMVEEMDAGPVIRTATLTIEAAVTASELAVRLAELGAATVVKAVAALEAGRAQERPQDHGSATFAPKITRQIARVDWSRSASEVACQLRAMDRKPGAWSLLSGKPVKLFRPEEDAPPPGCRYADSFGHPPGTVVCADVRDGLAVACGHGVLGVGEVQPPGKKRMSAKSWIAGRGVACGERFD